MSFSWLFAAGRFLKLIPWQVWAVLGVLLALGAGARWHGGKVESALNAADAAGYSRAIAEVKAEQARIAARALVLKNQAERLQAAANEIVRIDHAKDASDTRARADALRLRPPPGEGGSARCQADRAGIPGPAAPAAGQGEPVSTMASIPWLELVNRAERCDLNTAALTAWEQWYERQKAAWQEWEKAAQKP